MVSFALYHTAGWLRFLLVFVQRESECPAGDGSTVRSSVPEPLHWWKVHLTERAKRASRRKFERALKNVPAVEPETRDRL